MPNEAFVGNIVSGGNNRKAALLQTLASVLEMGYGENPEEASQNMSDLGALFKIAGQEQKVLAKSQLPKKMFEAMVRQQRQRAQGTPGLPAEIDAVREFLSTMQPRA